MDSWDQSVGCKGYTILVCTATVTQSVCEEVMQSLEMVDSEFVCTAPDKPNIFCEVCPSVNIGTDMLSVVQSLKDLKLPV